MKRILNNIIRYFDLQSHARGEDFDYIQAWKRQVLKQGDSHA